MKLIETSSLEPDRFQARQIAASITAVLTWRKPQETCLEVRNKVQLVLNGQSHTADDGLTVREFLHSLGVSEKGVAVERNLEIVPKSLFDDVVLESGDRLEIIQFVGGG